jgi:hypothetical protein
VETDPRIVEDDLDKKLAGHDEADGDGEVGDARKQGVARRVPDDRRRDRPLAETIST